MSTELRYDDRVGKQDATPNPVWHTYGKPELLEVFEGGNLYQETSGDLEARLS